MSDRETIQQAVREVRHEGYKAAVVHAVVDATAVALLVNLLVGRVVPVSLPGPWPADGRLVVAATAGLLALAVEFGLRARRYTVERFEAENPAVADALRTARDAAAADADSTMARRLYDDVADRLGRTSATGFVDTPLLVVGVVAVLLLSGATLGAAVAGVDLSLATDGAPSPDGGAAGSDGTVEADSDRLRDGSAVLGDRQQVSSGTDEVLANVSAASGGEETDRETARDRYEDSGFEETEPVVDAERAGFDDTDPVGDADLVREYTLRLSGDSDD